MTEQNNNIVMERFKIYEHFSKCLLDAFALLSADGKILKCNPLLPQMTGMTSKQLMKLNNIDEVLSFTLGDQVINYKEILKSKDPTRLDEVRAKTSSGRELNCIIGIYPFTLHDEVIGAFVLLRDVTAETQLQDKYKDKATQSITDRMTGLFNRAYFEEYLNNQDKQLLGLPPTSEHRKVSVVMCDIDHFKKINDQHGHPAGDYVIKTVGALMLQTFRKTDVVCRYGGEEFLVILPASDIPGAQIAAEKLRKTIQMTKFEFEGKVIPVTLSSGIAQVQVGAEATKDTIARADAALYVSKQSGRNRVSVHDGAAAAPVSGEPLVKLAS